MTDAPPDRPYPERTPPPGSGYPTSPARRRNGMGTAALILGVLALVLAVLIIFSALAIPLGLVAAILGAVGLARAGRGEADNRGAALAGLITGLLGLVIGVVWVASIGTFFTTHANDFGTFGRCIDRATTDAQRQACARGLSDRLKR
jgi:hypothetical protein